MYRKHNLKDSRVVNRMAFAKRQIEYEIYHKFSWKGGMCTKGGSIFTRTEDLRIPKTL